MVQRFFSMVKRGHAAASVAVALLGVAMGLGGYTFAHAKGAPLRR